VYSTQFSVAWFQKNEFKGNGFDQYLRDPAVEFLTNYSSVLITDMKKVKIIGNKLPLAERKVFFASLEQFDNGLTKGVVVGPPISWGTSPGTTLENSLALVQSICINNTELLEPGSAYTGSNVSVKAIGGGEEAFYVKYRSSATSKPIEILGTAKGDSPAERNLVPNTYVFWLVDSKGLVRSEESPIGCPKGNKKIELLVKSGG